MNTVNKRLHESDDEDDLELLRLAALKSLKKPADPIEAPFIGIAHHIPEPVAPTPILCSSNTFNNPSKGINKRGRYHGNGRIARNGVYNNRVRNYNLISVPTIEHDSVPDHTPNKKFSELSVPKLTLPQDRYCGQKVSEEKVSEGGSKFDRYNDSEESGTESESEHENTSETESPKKLERSNSLEALLQELENEIQGSTKSTVDVEKPEVKPKTKVKKLKTSDKLDVVVGEKYCKDESIEKTTVVAEEKLTSNKPEILEEKHCENKEPSIVIKSTFIPASSQNIIPQHSQLPPVSYINPPMPVINTLPAYPPVYPHFPTGPTIYSNSLPYPFPNLPTVVEPPRNTRSMSPLTINTDILNTITAPLSPRSAAFVLQNREIVERRKKSPRRSYSRSPTPEYRGSLSPRYRRSSPKRSPKNSPGRRISPVRNMGRRLSPKSNSRHCSPKHSISSPRRHNRHNRTETTKAEDENRINSLTRNIACRSPSSPDNISRTNSPVDMVFEARRKKFESGITVATAGVIRLKPKSANEDNSMSTTETRKLEEGEVLVEDDVQEEVEDLLLESDELDLGIGVTSNDIFSDEESGSDNEGRFKSNQQDANRVSMVPFTQLLNETHKMIRNEKLNGGKSYSTSNDRILSKDRQRSYSPINETPKEKPSTSRKNNSEKKSLKSSSSSLRLRMDSKGYRRKPPMVSPIESKKIEIKIRNPSKYESTNTNTKDDADNFRKVEVSNVPNNSIEGTDNEAKSFNESDDDSKNEGDLRTQLSRKRAERQNKLPPTDGVQSRLLQSALHGAIYKKTHKSKKEKEVAPLDGKLPIHLRLGIPGSLDIFSDTPVQKSTRKRSKNRGNLEQV